MAQALAFSPREPSSDQRLLDALQTRIEPVPLPFTYKAALAIVAFAMVLLPLVYVALVALAGWGVVWYALHGWALLAGVSSLKVRGLLFITPLIAGGTVVLFMIKPLFSRSQENADDAPLDPAEEPLLFELVRRTATAVGAPVPREIRLDDQVNASASFRRGLLSLLSDDLVLTVGVPLAAGLTLEQLTGVLAHEFGHFGQRAGMRLSYVIRSVNYWFARVVYERDRFDAALEESVKGDDSDWRLRAIAGVAAFFVWVGRTILKGLMYLGHILSASLLRQMEYDADRYAVRLVGRKVHAATLREVFLLSQTYQISLSAVPHQYRQGTLADSLAALMNANRQRFANPLDNAYKEHLAEGRTHLFDTHPTHSERIAKGLAGPAQGVFASELPASVVFRDFARLERERSRGLFEVFLGRSLSAEALVPADRALAALEETQSDAEAAERYLPGGVSLLHPLPLPGAVPAPPAEPRAALRQAVATVESEREALVSLLERFSELSERKMTVGRADMLMTTGYTINAPSFGLDRGERQLARDVLEETDRQLGDLALQLAPGTANVVRRMSLALALLGHPEAAGPQELAAWRQQAPRLLDAASRLRQLFPLLLQLRETRILMAMVGGASLPEGKLDVPMNWTQQGHRQLEELLQRLEGARDPFPEEPVLLSRIAAPDGLPPAEALAVYHAIGAAVALLELYERIVGRLCRIAEGMEAALLR